MNIIIGSILILWQRKKRYSKRLSLALMLRTINILGIQSVDSKVFTYLDRFKVLGYTLERLRILIHGVKVAGSKGPQIC